MRKRPFRTAGLFALLSGAAFSSAVFSGSAWAAENVPALLQQKCGACHGGSSGMSGLKVTARETLLKGGSRGPAIVPGKSSESLLYKAVAHVGDLSMPP